MHTSWIAYQNSYLFQDMRQEYTSPYEIVDFSLFITMLFISTRRCHANNLPSSGQAKQQLNQKKGKFLSHFSSFLTV